MGAVGSGRVVTRVTSGLRARMEWVMERRWWEVGETADDAGGPRGDTDAPESMPAAAAPADDGEGDEHEEWEAAAAAEAEADIDRAWEDAYQREMMMEDEAMMPQDAFGDG